MMFPLEIWTAAIRASGESWARHMAAWQVLCVAAMRQNAELSGFGRLPQTYRQGIPGRPAPERRTLSAPVKHRPAAPPGSGPVPYLRPVPTAPLPCAARVAAPTDPSTDTAPTDLPA